MNRVALATIGLLLYGASAGASPATGNMEIALQCRDVSRILVDLAIGLRRGALDIDSVSGQHVEIVPFFSIVAGPGAYELLGEGDGSQEAETSYISLFNRGLGCSGEPNCDSVDLAEEVFDFIDTWSSACRADFQGYD